MKSHFLFSGAFAVASLLIGHQVFSADPILEGGARMSTLIPSDTVGVNIHDMVHDVAHILKCTKHDNHAVSLPEEIGNMLLRMGLAVTRSDVGTSYYDLGASVVFQTTEQQLPLSYLKGESLQLVPHLSIKGLENKLLNTSDIHLNVVIQLWGASLEEDYDQFSIGDNLYRFLTKKELPSSTALRCRSLPTGIISSILIHKERKWNSTDHRYLTLPFDVHYLKVHPDSHQVDGSLHFYSLVHFDESDGLHSILTQHILHLPDPEERKAFWLQILGKVKTKDNFQPESWKDVIFCSKKGLLKCRELGDGVAGRDLPHTGGTFRIAMITIPSSGFLPWSLRMGVAAESLGWEWSVAASYPESQPYLSQKDFIKMFNPHCIIYFGMNDDYTYIHKKTTFLFFHIPSHVCQSFRYFRHDGFLNAATMGSLETLKPFFKSFGHRFFAIPNYPSACRTHFSTDVTPRKLFYCGGNWDDRKNEEYFKLWQALSNTGYFEAYGAQMPWTDPKTSQPIGAWKGPLPFDDHSVQDKARECGVALVVHGKNFRETGCITGRIFEAASSGAVIISDKHPFVQEHFKDSVLYIDTTKSAEQIFQDIDIHMRQILSHPQEAQELARRSHQIFCEKFALENLMRDILDLYESVTQGRATPGSKVMED